jgi:small nuclear ribonucleoprotein (snRNP)-like protein
MFQQLSEKGAVVSIELKNGLLVEGKLGAVDQNLNFNLYDINIDLEKFPHFVGIILAKLALRSFWQIGSNLLGYDEESLCQRKQCEIRLDGTC